ncbi:MAG: hypothetical protein ACXWTP_00300, partial [Methylosarcina sp.]
MSKRFIKDFVFEKHGKSKDLIILFHAYTSSPEKLNSVKEVCKSIDRYKNSDILIPRIPASLFSIADPVEITREILNKVDEVWDGNGQYSSIILIGHSLGALLARKLYVYACGKNQGVPFEIAYNKPKLWAGKVERIILLAGMNRGWSISYHMSLLNAVGYTIGSFIGDLIVFTSPFVPLIFRIKKGSSFITNLRIQWLAMRKEDNIKVKGAGNALTIQLLGSIDDIVSPEDNLDLVTGSDFFYIDAPNSGHANIIEMDSTKEGESRKKAFTEALLMDAKKVKNIHPSDQQFP